MVTGIKSLILYIIRKVPRNVLWLWQTCHWRIRNTIKSLGAHSYGNCSFQNYFICNLGTRNAHKEIRPGCGSTQNKKKVYETNPHVPLTRARKYKVFLYRSFQSNFWLFFNLSFSMRLKFCTLLWELMKRYQGIVFNFYNSITLKVDSSVGIGWLELYGKLRSGKKFDRFCIKIVDFGLFHCDHFLACFIVCSNKPHTF